MKHTYVTKQLVYIFDSINSKEIVAEHTEKNYFITDDNENPSESKTKNILNFYCSYPAGELLSTILSIDTDAFKLRLFDESHNIISFPKPLDKFKMYDDENSTHTINCIAAVREFIDILNANNILNTKIWLHSLYDFLSIIDYLSESDVQIMSNPVKDGCYWWKDTQLQIDWRVEKEEFLDCWSEKFNPLHLRDSLPFYAKYHENNENSFESYPQFAAVVRTPIELLFSSLEACLDNKIKIQKCKNCGKYFAPQNRSDTVYCDRTAPQDSKKSCKEYGARQAWEKTLKENEAIGLCRKIYMAKQMLVKRNPDISEYVAAFKEYKKQSKQWKADVRAGTKTEAEFIEWLKNVKAKKVL